MLQEPERVARLQHNAALLLRLAREAGIDTGRSQGHAIVPAITGSSLKAARLSNALFERGINVQPIVHPAVEEKAARLRFFVSHLHSQAQIEELVAALRELI
jgi:8-amino-7-oxononanoate synthase